MPDFTQIERILKIIQILSSGNKLTTAVLLSRIGDGVSLRTLQRDFNRIQAAGIPLQSRKTKANENEWYLEAPFRSFLPRTLGLNEYVAAHMLRENLKIFSNTSFSAEIDSLIEKIEQIVPENIFLETEEVDPERLYENYAAGIYDYTGFDETIQQLIQAIMKRRRCFVVYHNAYEDSDKSFYFEPRRLVYYTGSLYVVGYIRKFENFVILAIQRIRKLQVHEKEFPVEPEFQPDRFWSGKFGLFHGEPHIVTLRFVKAVRHHIEGRLWHPSQSIATDRNGNLVLTMEVGLSPELVSWVLGWSEQVEVIAPAPLINMIRERITAMSKIYSRENA